jgi:hypothetical protein
MDYNGLEEGSYNCPIEILAIFGPAPVLTDEARTTHALMFRTFAQTIKPRDFIEWTYVRDCTDHRCEISWLRKLKVAIVQKPKKFFLAEEGNKLCSDCDVEVGKFRQKGTAELASKIKELKGAPDHIKAETERLEAEAKRDIEIETNKTEHETHKKIKEWKLFIKSEVHEADLFGQWIGSYEQVDKRLQETEQKFECTLQHIDQYRHGLGERLRKAANEIIEGECKEELDPLALEQAKAQVTTAEVKKAEVTCTDVTTAEVKNAEVTSAEVTTAEVKSAEVTCTEVTTAEVKSVTCADAQLSSQVQT